MCLLRHLLDRRLIRIRLLTLTSHKLPNDIRVIHLLRRFPSPSGTLRLFVATLPITRRITIVFLFQNPKTEILKSVSKLHPNHQVQSINLTISIYCSPLSSALSRTRSPASPASICLLKSSFASFIFGKKVLSRDKSPESPLMRCMRGFGRPAM